MGDVVGSRRDAVVLRLDEDLDPWDQHEGESDSYYAAFRLYLRLARRVAQRTGEPLPRRLSDMVADTGWSHRHCKRIANQYRWDERAAAWDLDRENELAGKIADARVSMLHRRIELLEQMQDISMEALRDKPPEEWKTKDLLELMRILFMAQDQILGMGDRHAQAWGGGTRVGVDISVPMGSGSEIDEQYAQIMAELRKRDPHGGVVVDAVVDDDITDDDDDDDGDGHVV